MRRALRFANYRAAHGGAPEQGADLPVPRRRPSDRHRGDGRPGRHGGAQPRPGPDRVAPAQPHARRRLSLHLAAPACASRNCRTTPALDKLLAMVLDYERFARRAGRTARARASIAASASPRFIELTNPSPFMYGIGGARISAQDGATVRLDPDGSVVVASSVTEQGQGTEAILAQIVARWRRRRGRQGARRHRRHADHALWRRHLGLARCRHRRRGGAAGGAGAAGADPRMSPAAMLQAARPTLDIRRRRAWSTRRRARRASASPRSAASSISGATRCRATSRANSSRRATTSPRTTPSPSPTASRPAVSRSMSRPAS